MTLHYNIVMVLIVYRAQHQNLWCDCLESHTNCYSGHACRWESHKQFIEVLGASVNILWGFQYSVTCVGNKLESFLLLVAKP